LLKTAASPAFLVQAAQDLHFKAIASWSTSESGTDCWSTFAFQ